MTWLYSIPVIRKLLLYAQNLVVNLFYFKWFHNELRVYGFPLISFHKGSLVGVGHDLVLISNSYFSEPGVDHPVVLRTLTPQAKLIIGNNVGISGGGVCAANEVRIGNNVMLGANAFVTDTDFHSLKPENRRFSTQGIETGRTVIEDNVFVGMNTLVLKDVTIGRNSVIGAGSIVTGDIPPDVVAAGIPARVIRSL
jgi:acetyltransferase-like isoleucine patch superfamily enzyme